MAKLTSRAGLLRWAVLAVPTLLALSVGAGSAAAHAKSKSAHKKSKVLVHCASTTVRCHTHPGKRGPAGLPGASGQAGVPGAPGHGIAYRIRSAEAAATTSSGPTEVALSPPSFDQPPGQDDRLIGGVTITAPSGECESGKEHTGKFEGIIEVDGREAGIFGSSGSYSRGHEETAGIVWVNSPELSELFIGGLGLLPTEPSLQIHEVTAVLGEDNCEAPGATHFTVDSVAIDVLVSG